MSDDDGELLQRLRARPGDLELRTRLGTWARSEGRSGALPSLWLDRAAALDTELIALALDAHALGLIDRQRDEELSRRVAAVPILALSRAMVAVLAGEQDVEVLDQTLPGLVQRAIGRQCSWAVVDVTEAVQDETLAHTLAGLSRLGIPEALELGVTGADSPEWIGRCRALSDDPHRLSFRRSLGELLQLPAREVSG